MKRFSFYIFVATLTFMLSSIITEICNKPREACQVSYSRRISSCVPDSEKFKQKLRILENSSDKFYTVSCVCPETYLNQSCKVIYKTMVDK
jgi:hypothetical protein